VHIKEAKAIRLDIKGKRLAAAYANHKPTKRHPLWGWYMKIKGQAEAIQLGRLEEDQVIKAMIKVYHQFDPAQCTEMGAMFKRLPI
jgi:hypothetical protein